MFSSKVGKFISGFDRDTISNIYRYVSLLRQYGSALGFPDSRKIQTDLFELRVVGKIQVRLFYTFHKNMAVILHGYAKKSNKTPRREIETAVSRLRHLQSV